jgi:uncharacterized protein YhaN
MNANFGTLQNEEMTFRPGLNIICAPNESGKSTWCAFLRAMLYGVDSFRREKGGIKPDKLKYTPWSGGPMDGSMELVWRGKTVTLRRSTKSANAPMRQFSATYTGTREPVPGLDGPLAGETLTGVPAAVFERSAFIRQSSLGLDNSPELEKRIAAMVASGEEGVSYTEADERLRAWQRKRRFRTYGRLPELEEEIGGVKSRIRALKEAARELESLEDRTESCRLRREALIAQVEESRREQRKSALTRLGDSREEQRRLEREALKRREEANSLRTALENSVFAGALPAKWETAVAGDTRAAAENREAAAVAPSKLPWIASLLLGVALLAAGFWLSPYWFLPASALLGAAVWGFFSLRKRRERAAGAAAACAELLRRYGADEPEGITTLFSDYRRRFDAYLRAEDAALSAEKAAAFAAERQRELDAGILTDLDFEAGVSEAAQLSRRLAETDKELRGLRETCAMERGRLASMGDPLVLESHLKELEDEHREQSRRFLALELAVDTLREANAELQSRFSPRLAHRAAELMSRLTGGRYTELTLDRELSALVRRAGDTLPHETSFLSRGACDQFYLALRLALCELTLPEAEACPIVLDDALVNFDDERLGLALELLQELSEKRQIILFTCSSRETDYFEGKK